MGESVWSCVRGDVRDARTARAQLRDFLELEADASSDLDACELIAGELIANVFRHAPGPIGLYCSWTHESATLVVADRGTGIPAVRSVPDANAEFGRGLLLVHALARSVIVERATPHGSRLVVELPARRTA